MQAHVLIERIRTNSALADGLCPLHGWAGDAGYAGSFASLGEQAERQRCEQVQIQAPQHSILAYAKLPLTHFGFWPTVGIR